MGVPESSWSDVSDAVLMTSRGGLTYNRTFMSSFIRPGPGSQNWLTRSNYPALGLVQTGPRELSLYVVKEYTLPTAHLRRCSVRTDGFVSVHAPYEGGEMITRPLRFAKNRMRVNFATSAAGGIRVEIQGRNGEPLPGFRLDESRELIGDEIDRVVAWLGGENVSSLAGKPVRLRFVMRDADLYSLRFR